MDLENFENPDEISVPVVSSQHTSAFSAKEALEHIDQAWYTLANKRARWMDLLGDYAGTEPFVIDGMFLASGSTFFILTMISTLPQANRCCRSSLKILCLPLVGMAVRTLNFHFVRYVVLIRQLESS
jgi:hypothetical protein